MGDWVRVRVRVRLRVRLGWFRLFFFVSLFSNCSASALFGAMETGDSHDNDHDLRDAAIAVWREWLVVMTDVHIL